MASSNSLLPRPFLHLKDTFIQGYQLILSLFDEPQKTLPVDRSLSNVTPPTIPVSEFKRDLSRLPDAILSVDVKEHPSPDVAPIGEIKENASPDAVPSVESKSDYSSINHEPVDLFFKSSANGFVIEKYPIQQNRSYSSNSHGFFAPRRRDNNHDDANEIILDSYLHTRLSAGNS